MLVTFSFNNSLSRIRKNDINKMEQIAIKIFPNISNIDWNIPVIDDMFKIFNKSIKFISTSRFKEWNFSFISVVAIFKNVWICSIWTELIIWISSIINGDKMYPNRNVKVETVNKQRIVDIGIKNRVYMK